MSDFEKEYQKIMKAKLYDIYKYVVTSDRGINELIENQEKMKIDIDELKRAVSNIEEDIYEDLEDDRYDEEYDSSYQEDKMHDNDYEFEITCPYCNYDFIADNPKCKRIIDLDWSSTDEYSNDLEQDSESGDIRYSASDKDTVNNAVNEKTEQFRYNDDLKNRELKVPKAKSKKDTNKNNGLSQDDRKNENNENNECRNHII